MHTSSALLQATFSPLHLSVKIACRTWTSQKSKWKTGTKRAKFETNLRSEQCLFGLQMGAVEHVWQPSWSRDPEQPSCEPFWGQACTVGQVSHDVTAGEIRVGRCPHNFAYRLPKATLACFLAGFLPQHNRFLQIHFLEFELCQANHAKAASFPCVIRVDGGRL